MIGGKKKKVKDRPWKKAEEYDALHTTENMNIFGVDDVKDKERGDVLDPNNDDDEEDQVYEDLNSPLDKKKNADLVGDLLYDDVSSRWSNQQSSPLEEKVATVNAVGIAASRLADKLDDQADDEEEGYDDLITPKKPADHNRVRMEALNLLNLANTKDSRGGYLVKKENATRMAMEIEMKKNRVQSALQGISGGLGLENRKKYERFTPDKMEFDDKDKLHDVSITDMEYGESPSPKKKRDGNWGSRYSTNVDRQMMALYGGLSSKQVLSNLEKENYENINNVKNQNKSATNMYRTSPHDNDDRWNVASGSRTTPVPQSRMFNTWLAKVQESASKVYAQVSSTTSKVKAKAAVKFRNQNTNPHQTIGSHRQADHSSSPKNIFTGLAVTKFLEKLSPRSRDAAVRNFTDHPDDVNFSAHDDYVFEKRLRRRSLLTHLLFLLLALTAVIGIILGVSSHSRNRSGDIGAIYSDVGETVRFYATSDIPKSLENEGKLTRDLANLDPSKGDFLIHLGDVGDASVNMCTTNVYKDAADLLKQSPVPVFIIPGDNDWNNCPDPMGAFDDWMDQLNMFEDNFETDENFPMVRRQMARSENFSFLHKGVLFIAFHLVDGKVQSEYEWTFRIAEDVAWMDEVFSDTSTEEYRNIVIFAHSAPTPKVGDFVWPLKDSLEKINKPVLYLHANDEDGMLEYIPFPDELPQFVAIRMEKGNKSPPSQITIEKGPRPFNIQEA